MAFDNFLTQLMARMAEHEAKKHLSSQYGPPSRDDILHDGLVGVGETWGGVLGTAAGRVGGGAIGGPAGAIAGGAVLGPLGALGGGWAAHGAYLEAQLVRDILSHPENWTVDAAGAIVPSVEAVSPGGAHRNPPSPTALNAGAPPIQFFPQNSQTLPRGFPGWSSVTGTVPSNSMQPEEEQPGGLLGLLREHLRNNPY